MISNRGRSLCRQADERWPLIQDSLRRTPQQYQIMRCEPKGGREDRPGVFFVIDEDLSDMGASNVSELAKGMKPQARGLTMVLLSVRPFREHKDGAGGAPRKRKRAVRGTGTICTGRAQGGETKRKFTCHGVPTRWTRPPGRMRARGKCRQWAVKAADIQ